MAHSFVERVKMILFVGILCIASYLVPKNSKLLVFQTLHGTGVRDNPKYLYLYARKYLPDYTPIMFTTINEHKQVEVDGVLKHDFRLRNWMKILRAKYIFIETTHLSGVNLSTIIGRFNVVQCYHATPLKKVGMANRTKMTLGNRIIARQYKRAHLMVAAAPYTKEIFERDFECRAIIAGYPRNDILFDQETFSLQDLGTLLGVDKYSKVYCYAPTFREHSSQARPFTAKGLAELNKILKKQKALFLIKPHPLDKTLSVQTKYSNIKWVGPEVQDLQELFIHTDVLITDYSGAIFDFALTQRPLISYAYDYEDYVSRREMYFEPKKVFGEIMVSTEDELLAVIKSQKFAPFIKGTKVINKKFSTYADGNSCKRVYKALGIK